jgi:hypothetical protein
MADQSQALRKKPRAHFKGRWVWTGGENLASIVIRSPDRPARSHATPTTLSRPKTHQIRPSRERSFRNIWCRSNCKIIFITSVEVQFGYNNVRIAKMDNECFGRLWVSLVSRSLNPVTRCVIMGEDFQGLTGHGTARHGTARHFRFSINTDIKFM